MSECTSGELRDLLPELLNDGLDAATRERVEAHVASCTECAAELALLRALRPALLRGPTVDAQRIAAAVRASMAGAAAPAPARAGVAVRRKLAIAAAALLAASAIGYVALRRGPDAREVAVTPQPRATGDTTTRPAPAHDSSQGAPLVAPHTGIVRAPSQQVANAPPHVTSTPRSPVALASAGVLDNVSDLSDDDVRALTASLDKLSAVPDAEPAPGIDPLGASLDDLSGGGR